jgi:hypothetical protein
MNIMNRRQLIKMDHRTIPMSVVPIRVDSGYNDDSMHCMERLNVFDENLDNQVD